ncbi:MAG: sulfatase [Planctomycetota bacterium]
MRSFPRRLPCRFSQSLAWPQTDAAGPADWPRNPPLSDTECGVASRARLAECGDASLHSASPLVHSSRRDNRIRSHAIMKRVGVSLWAIVVFVLATSGIACCQDDRPNIIFIMSDDHGWQAIGTYGSDRNETPNIDRIAREGARLDNFFVGNSICAPSRATMLTGLHSHANGLTDNRRPFDASQRHIAKMLQDSGYQTALVGKWHLECEPTGFDYYDRLVKQGFYYNPVMRLQDESSSEGYIQRRKTGYVTDIITDDAIAWLETERDSKKPFLLCVHHKAPHRDWKPALRHLDLYTDGPLPEPDTLLDDWSGKGNAARAQEMTIAEHLHDGDLKLSPPRRMTPGQARAWDEAYAPRNAELERLGLEGDALTRWKYQRYAKDYLRCIASVDESTGRILDTLAHLDLDENTIVIYTSDQGWYLGEHGWYDKRWMYEESFRTPFLIRWPGVIEPGTVVGALTQNIDIAPTMLDAAGEDIPSDMHGVSMLPVLAGATPDDWRSSVYYRYYEYPGYHNVRRHEGVRTDRYKLIHFYRQNEWELYDLERDPDEMSNAIDDLRYVDTITALKLELERLKQQYAVPPGEHYRPPADGRKD